jgi:RNA recognition motif-containing protein
VRQGALFISRKLDVGNLPDEVSETELHELFASAGTVESVAVMRDAATGRARGFAFVEMGSDEEAQTAIRQLNASQLGGRSLTVNEGRPKVGRTGGKFGGGHSSRRRSEPRG